MKKIFLLFIVLAGVLTFSQAGYAAPACAYITQAECNAAPDCTWVPKDDGTGICMDNRPCNVSYCSRCIATNSEICERCFSGYTRTDVGQCQKNASAEMCRKTPESPETPVLEGDACHVAHCTKCCDADDDCVECETGWYLNDDMNACVVGEEATSTSKITALIVESDPCD